MLPTWISDLAAKWREQADAYEADGFVGHAVLRRVADELEVRACEHEIELLTIDQGASRGVFRERLGERLDGSFIGPAHRENVYRTNIQAMFHSAHDELADDPVVAELFPYQSIDPIDDGRTRPNHLALKKLGLNGTSVYRRDDPFWFLFLPPWGYM